MRKNKTFEAYLSNNRLIDNKSINQTEDANFFTSDTEAFINVRPMDIDFKFESAKIMMVNHEDGSIVTRAMQVDPELRVANYEIEADLMLHYGEWSAQVLFSASGETFTSDVLKFEIKRHLTDQAQPKLEDIESYTEFMKKASQELINIRNEVEARFIPKIGQDGTWHVDGKSTGTKAQGPRGPKGDPLKFEDLTQEQINQLKPKDVDLSDYATKDDLASIDVSEQLKNYATKDDFNVVNNTVKEIPSSFAMLYEEISVKSPLNHTHKIADVNGLQSALNGKAPKNHTHDEYLKKGDYVQYDDSYLTNEINRLRTELSSRPKKFVTTIGNGTTSEYTISHNLNTQDVTVSIYQSGSPYEEYLFEVYRTNINQVKLVANRAIKQNEFRVVIVG